MGLIQVVTAREQMSLMGRTITDSKFKFRIFIPNTGFGD